MEIKVRNEAYIWCSWSMAWRICGYGAFKEEFFGYKNIVQGSVKFIDATLTEVEIDFGTTPVNNKTFTITDVTITNTKKIIIFPSPSNATGQVGNDWEVDGATFSAKANTGNMTLYVNAPFSMNGKRKIYYQILN